MTFAPLSDLTVRVVPTANGRDDVQRTSSRIRHHQSVSSAVSSSQTSAAARATENVSASRTGAVSKKVSSTGSFLNQGRRMAARLYPLIHMSRKWIVSGSPGTRASMEDFGFELVCASCLTTRGVLDSERLPEACPS